MSQPPTPVVVPSTRPINHDVSRAIVLMIIAVTLFSCLDTAAKYLTTVGKLPVTQVIWTRFAVQFVLLLVLVPAFGVVSLGGMFRVKRYGWQTLRSVMMALTTAFNFLALQYLRLDQTITIMFLAPLTVALLAGPLLGEWVGWRRLVAILVGFGGIVVVVRPGFAVVNPALLFSFASMAAYVIFALVTRHIAADNPPLVTLFFSMFAGLILGLPFAIVDWQWDIAWPYLALLLSLGLLGGAGHYLFILAYRAAPAGSITPFIYLQIVSMTALGYLVFGDLPDFWTVLGSAIVVGSGVYLFHREQVVKDGG